MTDRTVPTDMDRRALMKLPLTTRRIVLKAFADVEVLTTALAAENRACERLADKMRGRPPGSDVRPENPCSASAWDEVLTHAWLAWAHEEETP